MPQNLVFTIILQTFRKTIKPFKIAAKIIFIRWEIDLNIQSLKIISYNRNKIANSTWCATFAVQYMYD